jgi:hypothetical protein
VFRPDDVRTVEPIEWIRENIGRFLVHGYDPVSLVMWLAEECFRLTEGRVSIAQRGPWLQLEAEVDWVEGWEDPFHRLTPVPMLGPNTVSLLVATVAFGDLVASWTAGGWEAIVGDETPLAPPPSGVRRVVAIQRLDS